MSSSPSTSVVALKNNAYYGLDEQQPFDRQRGKGLKELQQTMGSSPSTGKTKNQNW
jgi:hypothetical protein